MTGRWASSSRRSQLPKDWYKRTIMVKRRAHGRCEHEDADGVRCDAVGTDADHKGDRDDHDDLQWLCPTHHKVKTQREAMAKRIRIRRPEPRHPGLLED